MSCGASQKTQSGLAKSASSAHVASAAVASASAQASAAAFTSAATTLARSASSAHFSSVSRPSSQNGSIFAVTGSAAASQRAASVKSASKAPSAATAASQKSASRAPSASAAPVASASAASFSAPVASVSAQAASASAAAPSQKTASRPPSAAPSQKTASRPSSAAPAASQKSASRAPSASAAPVASASASASAPAASASASAPVASASTAASQRPPSAAAATQKTASKAPTAQAVSAAVSVAASPAPSQKAPSKAPTAQAASPAPSQKSASKAPTAASKAPTAASKAKSSFISELENALLNATNPLSSNESEEITVNGETGIFLNKAEVNGFKGAVALDKYPINQDPCPQIIKKKAQNVELVQDLSIKFLKPKLQQPGPITIRQEANKNVDPAPPVIIRQQPKPACGGGSKVFREVPPCLPKAPGPKCITIPGKLNPPPPRKVIIEKLAGFPPKPESISVERWVEPDPVKRQVKFIPAPAAPCVQKPRNIIIEWEAGQVSTKQDLKVLDVSDADPNQYRQQYNDLVQANQLPEFAQKTQPPNGNKYAADNKNKNVFYELEGDVQSLGLIDLDKEGLAEYKEYLQKLGINSNPNNSETDESVQYCPDYCPTVCPPPPTPKPDPCACN